MTKWKLTIEDDEGQRTSLDLDLEEYSVGRGEDRDVRLTERNISRRHALIRREGEAWQLFDEGSYNGSFVNGARVGADGIPFGPGDVANLGDYRIEIADATEHVAVEEPVRQRRPDRLICVIGPVPGAEFALEGDRLSIGRADEAYVTINHASVSRLHAELINLGEGRWEVVDQGSANGVRINGVELRRGIIEPGDALELGDVRLRFVAAGKFFRPAVDLSGELPAMPLDGMTAAAGSRPGSSRGLVAVVGILVLALVVGGGYALFAGGETVNAGDPAAPIATSDEQAQAYLDEAQQRATDGDIHAAHRILQKIPESSALRDNDDYRRIEDLWAEAMFKKAEEAKDPEEKVRIYNAISETTTVSADKRKQALELAAAIPASDTPNIPRPMPTAPMTAWPTGETPASTAKPTTSASSKAPPTGTAAGTGKFNEKSEKQRLLGKAMSGSASETELRMLKAICMNDGDRVCRDMATARLKALKDSK